GARRARDRGLRVYPLSLRDRAVRPARVVPLVRRVGGDYYRHVGAVPRRPAAPGIARAVTSPGEARAARRGGYLYTLALAALGVVYGDIGTSPLYAIRYSFSGPPAFPSPPATFSGFSPPGFCPLWSWLRTSSNSVTFGATN